MSDSPRPAAPADWDRLAELHERARAAAPAARRALLDELRASSPALAEELLAMLDATPTAAGLEIESRLGLGDSAPSLAAGARVGPWRLLRFLARGGMGEVYLAERADGAFEQQVAVKLLRPGIGSADLVERFRLERDLLARLEHPAVAPLLDAGTADDGRPYLALRYVEGRAITDFCMETRAAPQRRAELFVELCRAVQFAHTNLVVHRDLKPSNILVSADGRVHLLDFGVAKLLSLRDDGTQPTRSLELAPMTPQRAAPEQRRGEPVTTATDVWALGILLHELLTGRFPGEVAGESSTRVVRPDPGLDPDLSSVIGRALASEPERRYSSAGELADDVQRWLRGEPVRARPDSFGYRAGRFLSRHRLAAGASVAAFVALALLTLISIVRSREAAREREAAALSAARSEAVVDLVVDLFGGLDPIAGADVDTVRVSDLVALGVAKAAKLDNQRDVQARLRHVLGRVQLERGAWAPALVLLKQSRDAELARVSPGDLGIVPLLLDYARALHSTGERAGGRAEAVAALARVESAAAPPAKLLASTLATAGELEGGEHGEALVQRALALARAIPGGDRLEIAADLTSLAWFRRMGGKAAEARELFAQALAIVRAERGETHPHTLGLRSNLASMLADPAERVREHDGILALRRAKLGDHHYMVANSWSALGSAYSDLGKLAAAEEAFDHAHAIWVETGGPGNPMALAALRNLARTRERAGETAAADASWRSLADDLRAAHASPRTLAGYRIDLALHDLAMHRPAAAEAEADTALRLLAAAGEPSPMNLARARAARGRALVELGRREEGQTLLEAALATLEKSPPDNPDELTSTHRALGL